MESKLDFISNCFVYNSTLDINEMTLIWIDKLKIEIKELLNSKIIIIKKLDEIYEILKNIEDNYKIPTDCRFFAMFMASLKKFPDLPNTFLMNYNMDSIEIMVPDNCLYITLDCEKFVLSKDKANPTYVANGALG